MSQSHYKQCEKLYSLFSVLLRYYMILKNETQKIKVE